MLARFICCSLAAVAVGGCATMPQGPSMMVLPGTGQSFPKFQTDDYECRQYALNGVGGVSPNQAAVDSGMTSAVVGSALGAAAGAALGGGSGAAVGAGAGLVAGSLAGVGAANQSAYASQEHYDIAYVQCMYAKGHRVPVNGQFSNVGGGIAPEPCRRPANIPPPPPGLPPPPPPGH